MAQSSYDFRDRCLFLVPLSSGATPEDKKEPQEIPHDHDAAQGEEGDALFGFRVMGSIEPVMGRSGYPLLLQTGETADGTTPLLDRQHPHDVR